MNRAVLINELLCRSRQLCGWPFWAGVASILLARLITGSWSSPLTTASAVLTALGLVVAAVMRIAAMCLRQDGEH